MAKWFETIAWRLRHQIRIKSRVRCWWLRLLGLRVQRGTLFPSSCRVTWPHQVSIGRECKIGENVFLNYDGPWQPGPSIVIEDHVFIGDQVEINARVHVSIGADTLIASGCMFVDHDHGMTGGEVMRTQECGGGAIAIGTDCWLGFNVIVLRGVQIGDGAVIGAGSVVTTSVPQGELWVGVPARRLRLREGL